MTKRVDDFNSAQTPFEMTLEEIRNHWENYAEKINVTEKNSRILTVHLPEEDDEDDEGLGLVVEDKSLKEHMIIALYIFEKADGKGYELFKNLDPYHKLTKNEDPQDGTLCSMMTFPNSNAGVASMFRECADKILWAMLEGQDYPAKETERMKNAGSGDTGPKPLH